MNRFLWLLIDILVFSFLGIAFGFIIDAIFPEPHDEEELEETILYLIVQIVVVSLVVYFSATLYEKFVGRDPDLYYGFTLFIVLFFLVQVQLLDRLERLYRSILPFAFSST